METPASAIYDPRFAERMVCLIGRIWHFPDMSTKELALETIRNLPDSVSWKEIEERIQFLAAVERGRQEVREGKVIPHQEVKENLKEWITK